MQLRTLWRQLQESDTGVEMQAHRVRLRTHQNCIVGRDLVEWLTRNDKAMKRFAFLIFLDLKHYFELCFVFCPFFVFFLSLFSFFSIFLN